MLRMEQVPVPVNRLTSRAAVVGQLYDWLPYGTPAQPQARCRMRVTEVIRNRPVPIVISQDLTTCKTHINSERDFLNAGWLVRQGVDVQDWTC